MEKHSICDFPKHKSRENASHKNSKKNTIEHTLPMSLSLFEKTLPLSTVQRETPSKALLTISLFKNAFIKNISKKNIVKGTLPVLFMNYSSM